MAGEPADEVMARVPRGEAEIPLIRMALMEGRPVELLHRVMAEMSAVVARVLGGDPQRVRVQIAIPSTPDSETAWQESARRSS